MLRTSLHLKVPKKLVLAYFWITNYTLLPVQGEQMKNYTLGCAHILAGVVFKDPHTAELLPGVHESARLVILMRERIAQENREQEKKQRATKNAQERS